MKSVGTVFRRIIIPLFAMAVLISCAPQSNPEPTATGVQASTETVSGTVEPTATSEEEDLAGLVDIPERTPLPTITPSQVDKAIEGFAVSVGIEEFVFLGLRAADWLNIGVSILLVLAGMVVARVILDVVLGRFVKRTETEIDDLLLAQSKQQLNWLITAIFLEFAILRLQFLDPIFKERVRDLFFIIYVGIVLVIVWRLIGLAVDQLRERLMRTMDANQADFLPARRAMTIQPGRNRIPVTK